MSDFLGIDLIVGLNEAQSKTTIDAAIKRLSGKLDQLKVNLDIDDKALQTIRTFNTEMKKLSQAAEKTGQSVNQAMTPSGSEDMRTAKTKELTAEMQRLERASQKQSKTAQSENQQEAKTLHQLTEGYTKLNQVVQQRDKYGNATKIQHNLADQHGDISRVVTTDGKGDVVGYRDVQAIEKTNKRLQSLTDERQALYQKLANIQQQHGNNVSPKTMQMFSQNIAKADTETLKRISTNVDDYGKSMTKLQSVQSFQREMMQKIRDLDFQTVGKIKPEFQERIEKISNSTMNLNEHMDGLTGKEKAIRQSFSGLSQEVRKADQGMARFSGQMASAMVRIPIYAAGMAAMYAPLKMFKDAINQIIEIDTQITVLKRVTNGAEDINSAMTSSIDIAKRLGNVISEVNEGLINFARQGYRGDDLTAITEVATVMGNVSDLSIDDSASSLTAAMKGFNIEAQNSIRIVDAMNEVDNNYSITTQQLAQSIMKSAGSSAVYGSTLERNIGYATAIGEVTRESGNIIGNVIAV